MTLGIKLSLNDVKPGKHHIWQVSRIVFGDEIKFSGPDQRQALAQAQAHFNRIMTHRNAQGQEKAEVSTCAYRVERS